MVIYYYDNISSIKNKDRRAMALARSTQERSSCSKPEACLLLLLLCC